MFKKYNDLIYIKFIPVGVYVGKSDPNWIPISTKVRYFKWWWRLYVKR